MSEQSLKLGYKVRLVDRKRNLWRLYKEAGWNALGPRLFTMGEEPTEHTVKARTFEEAEAALIGMLQAAN